MILWDVVVDGPPHSDGTPSAVQIQPCFLMNMFLFNTLLCIAYSSSDDSDGLTDPPATTGSRQIPC